MPSKTSTYLQLAEETARRITGSIEGWTSFLDTASRLYKYPYHEQLMIYAQRPDATACATYDLWNNTMRRYVRRGARSIALLDTSGESIKLKYVFDVSDTGERSNSRPLEQWKLDVRHAVISKAVTATKTANRIFCPKRTFRYFSSNPTGRSDVLR